MFGHNAMRHLRIGRIQGFSKTKPKLHMRMLTVATGIGERGLSNSFKNMASISRNFTSQVPPKLTSAENIVWFDMEMTGLDPDNDHVLEVACLVTDGELNILEEGPDLCIYQPSEILNNMNDWSCKQHAESGLTNKVETSAVTLQDAERQLLDFVRKWTPFKKCPLGGNTIYMDRLFLRKHMPEFEQHMHYRIIDVSSVKEICRRWYPEIYLQQPNKKELSKHRALEDIKASVNELKFYKDKIFRKADGEAMGMSWC